MNTLPLDAVGYINAGGRGTRLNGVFVPDSETGIAKALLTVGNPGTRLIDHHIVNLQNQGIEQVVVAAGDQKEVYEYVSDVYSGERTVIATSSLGQQGTGGDLLSYVRSTEAGGTIVVQNVDTILDINLDAFVGSYRQARTMGAAACIALTLNRGVPNEDAYAVDGQGKVVYSSEFCGLDDNLEFIGSSVSRASSTGAVAIDAEFLKRSPWQTQQGQLSLYRHILKDAWSADGLFAYDNGTKFFRDIGTAATWTASQNDVEFIQHVSHSVAA